MLFKKYKKKPVEIKAMELTEDLWQAIYLQEGSTIPINGFTLRAGHQPQLPQECFYVETLEDVEEGKLHKGQIGDYLIVGVKGEIYACKPDIFHETYEEVE